MSSDSITPQKQHKLSIRWRITLYYAVVLLLMVLLVSGLLAATSDYEAMRNTKQRLVEGVQGGFEEIEFEDNFLDINEDFDTYYHGAHLIIYTGDGVRLKGSLPKDFPDEVPLEAGEFKTVKGDEEEWLVYDAHQSYEDNQVLWIRGIYNMDNITGSLSGSVRVLLLALPILVGLAILIGYRMAKTSLDPIAEMIEAANHIEATDLSERIPLGRQGDELYALGDTLNTMLDRLEEAFQNEKQFSSDVSHELKTPVTAILAEAEFALQEQDQAQYQEALTTIQAQARRMQGLIGQMLRLSRSMDKEALLEREEVDLSLLTESAVEELQVLAKEKGVRLTQDIQEDVIIQGDEGLLLRMIMNLVDNGIKYRRRDEAEPFVNVMLRKDSEIRLLVQDNGQGIAADALPQIFDRLYKEDSSRTNEEEGFGIGLALVKWVAEAHGGTVDVTSTKDKGSTFVVILPLEKSFG